MNNNYNIYKVLLDIMRFYGFNLAKRSHFSIKIKFKTKFIDNNKKV
jgi:hypothetical protein